jgi:nitrogen fixation/metabolism regulation signal transduction histidine kinase
MDDLLKKNVCRECQTFFASPERATKEEIAKSYKDLFEDVYIKQLINAMPALVAILNKNRQVVFSSDSLLELLGQKTLGLVLGKRPGELFHCVNAFKLPGGCGTSKSCQFCGAVNAILKSQKEQVKVEKECRITAVGENHEEVQLDLKIMTTPFLLGDEQFTIVTIQDIGDLKHKRYLERIFVHDVLNIAGGLRGFLEYIKLNDMTEVEKDEILNVSNILINNIEEYKELLAAENGELNVSTSYFIADEIIQMATNSLKYHDVSKGKHLKINSMAGDISFETDSHLLIRVLVNLLKNAYEAIPLGGEIELSSAASDTDITFSVSNKGSLSEEAKSQIFQRFYSTKGENRGVGTYSIKLLTERYLKGHVSFKSTDDGSVVFTVSFPRSLTEEAVCE